MNLCHSKMQYHLKEKYLDNVNQFFDKAKEASKKLDADAKSSWENKVE